jgi:hypothetical protein
MDSSVHRGPFGGYDGGVALPGTLRKRLGFVLPKDFVYWGLQLICNRRLWKRAVLYKRVIIGNLVVSSFYWGL